MRGIPRNLLKAISLAESGRWDAQGGANFAWPWTVTAEGRGRFFDTKAEALAEVEILMTEGVRNIDVGCMQVNLYYHGGAFETLDEAFDPRANTLYAASYLKNMYDATGDWTRAAGYYHSMTPERYGPYRDKVLAFWRRQGGRTATAAAGTDREFKPPQPIDHARTNRLNAAFKTRRDAGRGAAGGAAGVRPDAAALAEFRRRQLDKWRNATDRGLGTLHLIAMRRAELSLKRQREMDRLTKGDEATRFDARRRKQLLDWRMRISGAGRTAGAPAPAPTATATGMAAAAAAAAAR